MAVDSQGNAVVVWSSRLSGQNQSSVYMQRFDSAGMPVGIETKISVSTPHATVPRVVNLGTEFVVTWELRPDSGNEYDALARRIGWNGEPISGEMLIAGQSGEQRGARVSVLPDGGYYAVWESAGPQDTGLDIHGQQYSASGERVGEEIVINSYRAGNQQLPTIAYLGPNRLLVAWDGEGDGDTQGIFCRVLELTNVLVSGGDGGGIYNAGTLNSTNVTISGNEAASDGGGIYNAATGNSTLTNVTITKNLATGTNATDALDAVGGEFRVNTITSGIQQNAEVAMDPSGRAAVLWASYDVPQGRIEGQYYNADGTAASIELQPSGSSPDIREVPDVAMMDNGNSLAVWMGSGIDGSGYGIAGRLFFPNGVSRGIDVNPNSVASGA